MKHRNLLIVFLAVLMALPVFAEEMPSLSMPTVATNGFGGHHVAYTDNVFSLLVNPAAMIRTQQKSFFTISTSVMSPESVIGLIDPIKSLVGNDLSALGDAAQTLSDKNGKIGLGVEIRELFPFSFGYVANGFGFGLWDRFYTNVNIRDTHIDATAIADVMLPIGFAFKVLNTDSHSIDVGVTIKPFARAMAYQTEEIIDLASDTSSVDTLLDNINMPVIVGGGIDLGIMYRSSLGLQAGFTFNDIYSRGEVVYNINELVSETGSPYKDTNSYRFPFTMNAGLSWHFDLLFLGLTVAADWHNVANFFNQDDYLNHRNWFLDLSAGVEVSLFRFLYVRAGMNEMLPACGVGLSLGPCKIDLAYYGRELGMEPGQLSVPVAEVSIAIRPGAKKRDRFWTQRSVVGLFTGVEKVEEETE